MGRNQLSLWCSIAVVACAGVAVGQEAVRVAQRAFPATVLISTIDTKGQQLALGSGFKIGPGLIATNYHVVENAAAATVKLIREQRVHNATNISRVDLRNDLAILSVPTLAGPNLTLGDSSNLQIGESVYAVGNPKGLEGTFSTGIISAIRPIGKTSLIQLTAPISPGSSGGPVLNRRGEVVGISVASFKGGQNLNLAIPSALLRRLLLTRASNMAFRDLAGARRAQVVTALDEIETQKITTGIVGGSPAWVNSPLLTGNYAFSIRNNLNVPVRNVVCLVIFYESYQSGSSDNIMETTYHKFADPILPGLARRVTGRVEPSVQKLAQEMNNTGILVKGPGKFEFRILDFEVVSQGN